MRLADAQPGALCHLRGLCLSFDDARGFEVDLFNRNGIECSANAESRAPVLYVDRSIDIDANTVA